MLASQIDTDKILVLIFCENGLLKSISCSVDTTEEMKVLKKNDWLKEKLCIVFYSFIYHAFKAPQPAGRADHVNQRHRNG